MAEANIRDLRYRFSEIEARLAKGEEIVITRRKQPVARLLPVRSARADIWLEDLDAFRRRVFKGRKAPTTGTELMQWARGYDDDDLP